MHSLAEATNRLCAEILALRSHRKNLRRALQEQSLLRRASIKELCSDLRHGHQASCGAAGERRRALLNNLRRTVGAQRREMRSDLTGARQAWLGKRSSGHADFTASPGYTATTQTTSRKDRRGGGPN